MSGNTFGHLFRVTTFGESHGTAIGCMVDGVPPLIPLAEDDIQFYLDRRRPGRSHWTSQRKESDHVQIISGVFEGQTTGTPVGLYIVNEDTRPKDYEEIKDKFRPGHADFTYYKKYGIRDYRGGGRASARETTMRVAAGAIARKVLGDGVTIRAAMIQMGGLKIDRERWDWDELDKNPFWCPDAEAAKEWEVFLEGVRKAGSSTGAVVEVEARGVPAGLGAPVFDKLDGDIAKALMSIPAVKGVEIGAGFGAAALTGPENSDPIRMVDGEPAFLTNNAGGLLGGISNGDDIVARLALKPTSSIPTPQPTITKDGEETEIVTKGRHDPCVGIRGVPVAEAMLAIVLADHMLRHKAQCGG